MTRNQFARMQEFYRRLKAAGFDADEADQLRRIEQTLQRWAERECNGEIERAGQDCNGFPYHSDAAWGGAHLAYRIPDRERGALRRLQTLMAAHDGWTYYYQGDPRGCMLYLVRVVDIPIGEDLDACYSSRGIAVCV